MQAFEAVLASVVMEPLSDAMGPLGAVVTAGIARQLGAQRSGEGA